MLKPTVAETDTEPEFTERRAADRERFKAFYDTTSDAAASTANPGHALAREYFQYYLDRRPSNAAAEALAFAFWIWEKMQGTSTEARRAVGLITEDPPGSTESRRLWAEVWGGIGGGIIGAHWRDDELEDGLRLVERFASTLGSPTAEATLLSSALTERMRHNLGLDIARANAQRILELDTSECSEWLPRMARGSIHECDNLNVGQPAPQFRASDMDGNEISLQNLLGRVIILNFWSTTCAFCADEFPYLRQSIATYGDQVCAIGISLDEDASVAREYVKHESIDWPQICDGHGGTGEIPLLYNVFGIPRIYVIDERGRLAAKRIRDTEIVSTVKDLCEGLRATD